MRTLLISLWVLTVAIFSGQPASADVTMQTCEEDYTAQLQAAEDNRKKAVKQLENALARTADDETAGKLQEELERAWEQEEEFRNMASTGYRDCVKFVKSKS